MSARKLRVCFVCLGNICRSPTAEAIFRRDVYAAGLEDAFDIDSAGTGDWHLGELAHVSTRAEARQRGVEITHRARQFTARDLREFDWVLAMDRSNVANLHRLADQDATLKGKVRLLREFEPSSDSLDVPDPYHDGGFDVVFEICERASAGLLAHLRRGSVG
jgi:protein-tyrosine phosphatase